MDIEPMPNTRSSYTEPPKPMTTFSGHTKPTTISESETALNNFKKGTRRDASAYPIFKNDLYYDIFERSFVAVIKHKNCMMLLTLIVTLMMVISMTKNYSKKNNSLFLLYCLLPFRQKRRESWLKNLKEVQDPSFQNCTIIILSQMLHNMKLSL